MMCVEVRAWVRRDVVAAPTGSETARRLEGAADADFGDPVRRPLQDASPSTGCRRSSVIEPGEQLNTSSCRRRSVRSAQDLALVHVRTRHSTRYAPNTDADVVNRKQGSISLHELGLRHLVSPPFHGAGMTREAPAVITKAI